MKGLCTSRCTMWGLKKQEDSTANSQLGSSKLRIMIYLCFGYQKTAPFMAPVQPEFTCCSFFRRVGDCTASLSYNIHAASPCLSQIAFYIILQCLSSLKGLFASWIAGGNLCFYRQRLGTWMLQPMMLTLFLSWLPFNMFFLGQINFKTQFQRARCRQKACGRSCQTLRYVDRTKKNRMRNTCYIQHLERTCFPQQPTTATTSWSNRFHVISMSMTELSSHVAVVEGKPGAWTKKSNKNTFQTFYSKWIIRINVSSIYIYTFNGAQGGTSCVSLAPLSQLRHILRPSTIFLSFAQQVAATVARSCLTSVIDMSYVHQPTCSSTMLYFSFIQ